LKTLTAAFVSLLAIRCCRKIFVGGLSWDTTNETLCTHFGVFGEVTDAHVM